MILLDIDNLNILVLFILAFISFKGYQADAELFDSESEDQISQTEQKSSRGQGNQINGQSEKVDSFDIENDQPKSFMRREENISDEIIPVQFQIKPEDSENPINKQASSQLGSNPNGLAQNNVKTQIVGQNAQIKVKNTEREEEKVEREEEKVNFGQGMEQQEFKSYENEVQGLENSEFDSIDSSENSKENGDEENEEGNPESPKKHKKIRKELKRVKRELIRQHELIKQVEQKIQQEIEQSMQESLQTN